MEMQSHIFESKILQMTEMYYISSCLLRMEGSHLLEQLFLLLIFNI